MKEVLVVVALAVLGWFACPAPSAAEEAAPVDSALRADIIELLDLTGASKMGEQMGGMMTAMTVQQLRTADPDIPEEYLKIAQEEMLAMIGREIGALTDRMVPLYARHLSREDVRGLIAFYRTDLGRKTIETMPAIMQDSMRIGQEWGMETTPKLMRAIQTRLEQEGYTPRKDG